MKLQDRVLYRRNKAIITGICYGHRNDSYAGKLYDLAVTKGTYTERVGGVRETDLSPLKEDEEYITVRVPASSYKRLELVKP